MLEFKSAQNNYGFNFVFERTFAPGEEQILKMPAISPNKRSVNDIGFAAESGITLYSTISSRPESDSAIWQKIEPFDEINKTTSYIKIANTGENNARVNIRVILC